MIDLIESKSWIVVLVLAILMAINSIYLFLKFEEDRIVGPVFFVISSVTGFIVWQYFRFGVVWAWYAAWVFPISFIVVTIAFIIMKKYSLATYYGIASLLLIISVLLPFKEFFPKP